MWSLLYEYLRLRQEKLASTSAENDAWSNVDLPSITITSQRESSSPRQQQTQKRHSNQQMQSELPMVFSLARNWAFPAVAFRCQTNPEEASSAWMDEQGDNALHWVVFGNPPLYVVEELLRACPNLASRRNKQATLPLHVACSYRASIEVITALVESYPQAAGMSNGSGSFPLHLVCDYGCSVDTLHRLLQTPAAIPTLHKLDRLYQRRPLDILNARKNMRQCFQARQSMRQLRQLQQAIIRNEEGATTNLTRGTRGCPDMVADKNNNNKEVVVADRLQQIEQQIREHGNTEFWKKAAVLITAQHTGQPLLLAAAAADNDFDGDDSKPGGQFHLDPHDDVGAKILQAAVANHNCPPSLQEFAILLYQPFLLVPDECGRLPLHVAAAAAETRSYSTGNTTALLLDLMAACPEAAHVRDAQGRLPLMLALQSPLVGKTWTGVTQALVEAYPAALQDLDLPNVLLPRIWSKFASPNTLYETLRAFIHQETSFS